MHLRLKRVSVKDKGSREKLKWNRYRKVWTDGSEGSAWDGKILKRNVLDPTSSFSLTVHPRGHGFPIDVSWDSASEMLSGFDEMNEKSLEVGKDKVAEILRDPNVSACI